MTTETQTTTTENAADTTQTASTPDPKTEAKFTQADMDKIAGNRAKEAAAAAVKKLLKDLGIENPDDPKALETVKGKLTAAQEAEKAAMTKEQLLQQERDAALKERDEAKNAHESERTAWLAKERESLVKDALRAPKAHCTDPVKVLKLLKIDHPEMFETVMKDGKPDETAIKALVDLGKKENPKEFTGGGPSIPSNQNGWPTPMTDKAAERRVAATSRNITRG